MNCLKCKEEALISCDKCEGAYCLSCSKTHLQDPVHLAESYYFCQECEEEKATKYCYSCDQHLCTPCNGRIHNKGKRGQHKIEQVLGCQKFNVSFLVIVLQDATPNPEDLDDFLLIMKQKITFLRKKQQLKKQNIHFLWENSSLPEGFHCGLITSQTFTDEYLKQYSKYFPMLDRIVLVDSHQSRQVKAKLSTQIDVIQINGQQQSKTNLSYTEQQSRTNISISTENESLTKGRKPAIAYFQFYKLAKQHKKSETQIYMRKLASEGQLLVKQKDMYPIQGVIRSFTRTVGQLQIQYCSLDISYLSIQSLIWVIRSIKVDRMTPGEKLVLSRVKECFDIKVHSKLWQSILTYITSKKYQQDYQRMMPACNLPKIIIQQANDQHLLLLKNEEWVFQDQEKLNQNSQQWNQFTQFLLDYFDNHKTIPGGRYGCVQFAKMFGPKSLEICSLGKLSMFVQQAINKGLIRYHKTLLIKNVIQQHQSFTNQSSSILEHDYSFQLNDKQLYLLQKQIKIKSLQVAMINLLYEQANEQVISLAQIPHNLRKSVSFDFNLPDLGFPKLKNLIMTLSDIITMDINKSTLTFSFHPSSQMMVLQEKEKLQLLLSDYFRMIVEILQRIIKYTNIVVVSQFYLQLNTKLGFEFEFRLYGATDFCHFLCCYCGDIVSIQIVNGTLVAYSTQPYTQVRAKPGPQTSTPDFCNSFEANKSKTFNCKLPDSFYNWVDERKQQEQFVDDEVGQGISDIQQKQLYSIMDDDQKSQATLKTFIEKQNIVNDLNLSIYTLKPQQTPIPNTTNKNHNKALSQDFDVHKKITNHGRSTSYVQGKNKTPQQLNQHDQ